MSPSEFRKHGHAAVDWIASYMEQIREYPVASSMNPGDLVDRLPASGPEDGEPFERIFDDFQRTILPGVTHWNHPGFMGYFSVSGAPPGILGELLASALNLNGMLWKASPAVTELELVTLAWLRQWLGLPEEFFGMIHDTASTSTFHAVVAAREVARGSGALALYCSDQAHSSVEKAATAAGVPRELVRKIASDGEFRMRAPALADAMEEDRAAGRRPFCVVATVGTTPAASVDPVPAIGEIARRHQAWLHVDAAYAGSAAVSEQFRWVMDGCDRADSLVVNPHKWLLAPVDCSLLYTRRPEALRRAFSLVPDYLRTPENPRAINLMDYSLPLGRRFRALKLWFILRSYGRRGLAAIIEKHCALAREFAAWLKQDERFEVCAPVLFSLVCFRLRESDEATRRLLDRINESGIAFLSATTLEGRFVLRLAIGNYQTERDDLVRLWERIRTWV